MRLCKKCLKGDLSGLRVVPNGPRVVSNGPKWCLMGLEYLSEPKVPKWA